ncbi:hypothetical protein FHS18_001121 [Paenibacillus phyllosphaerae]|uniref:Pyridoxal phosphate homeostasis protein n=1 Tax=Paenibacillus phyllosphaerae TaxID=274593 RepID=A0A7W5AUM1_9BACL|nr:YggS family pyridoxal phosphate-dependent enzyme [Paenibacillus phyllosphaerae]MBB3109069.1 hypothetical protein [Paenibacillus phyllosphaerae]
MTLSERIDSVEQRLLAACARSGRKREEIQLIAVTKYVGIEETRNVLAHGLVHMGENRWQDAAAKWNAISGETAGQPDDAVWHFIGSLQTNKVKEVVGRFTYIHSLDRTSLAEAINKRAEQLGITVPCFIQVNVSGEESKHGLTPDGLWDFARELPSYSHIQPVGLMTMAPLEGEAEESRPYFRGLRQLRDELNERAILREPIQGLSMGMSGDFEVAVEEGANWLRLGTILVGKG